MPADIVKTNTVLKPINKGDIEQIRIWRNEQLEILRTSFPLTVEMQQEFYDNVICNRKLNSRYWGIYREDIYVDECRSEYTLIGMCGIENIQWEDRLGEISLLLNPLSNQNNICLVLDLVLDKAFNYLNLENIFTEVYSCNPNIGTWSYLINKYKASKATLPNRKFYKGKYFCGNYINFNRERYNE